MSGIQDLEFFLTESENCSYLPEKQSSFLVLDPTKDISPSKYSELLDWGFRRSGTTIYRPQCKSCKECVPIRIPVENFAPKRRHRRILNKNSQICVSKGNPFFSTEHFNLYAKYISLRHKSGAINTPTVKEYKDFLVEGRQETNFYEYREDGILLAISVTDSLTDGISAVYNFYDPELTSRGLGIFMILSLIEETIKQNKRFLYIGYWIKECKKMSYKNQFDPSERLIDGKWIIDKS